MDAVLEALARSGAWALLFALGLALVALLVALVLAFRLARMQRAWAQLLNGSNGENLERLLQSQLREQTAQHQTLQKLLARTDKLEDRMQTSKRFVGLVKYDAFDDVGGQQSFALAVYDDQGNGAVLSSIVGRADCRVYCKPLLGGRSERGLSQEEQRAILEAVADAPKTIVSK
jgi:hypothetical protein